MESLQLSVSVREVYLPGVSSQQYTCQLTLLGQVLRLRVALTQPPFKPVVVQTQEVVTGNTEITVQLMVGEAKQAQADFQLKEFFGEKLTGESENWILLNDSLGAEDKRLEYTQVKLWMGLQTVSKPKAPVRRTAARSLSSGGLGLLPQTCPFLSKVEAAAKQDREGKR